MSYCAVVPCLSDSKRKDKIIPLTEPIVIDDAGTVFDGLDIKFNGPPTILKARGKNGPTTKEILESKLNHNKWIAALKRADKLPAKPCACSRHYAKDAYNTLLLLKHNCASFKELADKMPNLRLLKDDALPTLNMPNQENPSSSKRSARQEKRVRKSIVADALKINDR
jgi:hypothetical protein